MKKIWLILCLLPAFANAQIGGRHVYDFLNLTPQARISALGGVNVAIVDHDPTMGWFNPAVVNDSMHNRVSFSFVDYLAGISYGYASYAYSLEGIADFHTGFQFVNYGEMIEADIYGNKTGTFRAGDIAWVVGASRQFYNFRMGANMKLINSSIAGYNSFTALAFDIGGTYQSENKLFVAGMVFKNMGVQLSKYTTTGQREPLPFETQVGLSYKLEHMPLRFNFTATNLEHPRLFWEDPNPVQQFDLSGEPIKQKKRTMDNIFGHFVFAGEFLLSKNFNLRFGYNHLRRAELRSENRAGLSGFSFGAGLRIYRFNLDYGYAHYHAIGGSHSFSIATDIDGWKK